ncbi:MAG: ATP-binding protein [Thermaerobacter sp.]|nr:ATP-binding protein [Thermaerobacter sp.]
MAEALALPRYFEANVLWSGDRVHAVYELSLSTYQHLSEGRRLTVAGAMSSFLLSRPRRGHLISVTRDITSEEYVDQLAALSRSDQCPGEYAEAVSEAAAVLRDTRPVRRRLFLLLELPVRRETLLSAVPLPRLGDAEGEEEEERPRQGMVGSLREWARDVRQAVHSSFGLREDIPVEEIEEVVAQERLAYQEVADALGGRRATPEDVAWLVRRNFYRGIQEPPWTPPKPRSFVRVVGGRARLRPVKNEVLSLVAGAMVALDRRDWGRSLVVHHEDGAKSYQQFLFFGRLPEEVAMPGGEFLFWLEDLSFPVDVSVHFEVQPPESARAALSRQMKAVKDQANEFASGRGQIPEQLFKADQMATHLEANLDGRLPLLWATMVLGVGAPVKDELKRRVGELVRLYRPAGFEVVSPPGDALTGLNDFFPGSRPGELAPRTLQGLAQINVWSLPMDVDFLAAAGLHAGKSLGDPQGVYAAYAADTERPVLLHLARATRILKQSGAILILGTLGGGKSALLKLLAYITLVFQGGVAFLLDPKDEYWALMHPRRLPELSRLARRIVLEPGSDTRFNPFVISKNLDRARVIVTDFLAVMLEARASTARRSVLHQAVKAAYETGRPDMNTFRQAVETVRASSPDTDKQLEAGRILDLLEIYESLPVARLVFATYEEGQRMDLAGSRLTIVSLKGLGLPQQQPDRDRMANWGAEMTESERLAVAIFLLVARLGQEVLMEAPKELLKLFGSDESWMALAFPEGQRLLRQVAKMGRTFNIVPVISTQNAADIDDQLRNLISQVFVFHLESDGEILDALRMVGLVDGKDDPAFQDLAAKVRDFRAGRCFYKDLEGRVGEVQVELVPHKLLDAFDTTPDRMADLEREFQGEAAADA